jgi:hypothetical protein
VERNRPEELDEVVPEEVACVIVQEQAKQEGEEKTTKTTTEKETTEDERRLQDAKAASEAEKWRLEVEAAKAEQLQQEAMREAEETEDRMKTVEEGALHEAEDMKVRPTSEDHEEARNLHDISGPKRNAVHGEACWDDANPDPVRRFGVNPVGKGLVQKLVVGHGMGVQSPKGIYSPKLQDEMNRTIGKGLVAQYIITMTVIK